MEQKTKLLNRSAMRDYALALIVSERPHLAGKLTRVSGDFFVRMEAQLRVAIQNAVRCAPSVGKTLK